MDDEDGFENEEEEKNENGKKKRVVSLACLPHPETNKHKSHLVFPHLVFFGEGGTNTNNKTTTNKQAMDQSKLNPFESNPTQSHFNGDYSTHYSIHDTGMILTPLNPTLLSQ